jgi:hypothetical protein
MKTATARAASCLLHLAAPGRPSAVLLSEVADAERTAHAWLQLPPYTITWRHAVGEAHGLTKFPSDDTAAVYLNTAMPVARCRHIALHELQHCADLRLILDHVIDEAESEARAEAFALAHAREGDFMQPEIRRTFNLTGSWHRCPRCGGTIEDGEFIHKYSLPDGAVRWSCVTPIPQLTPTAEAFTMAASAASAPPLMSPSARVRKCLRCFSSHIEPGMVGSRRCLSCGSHDVS